MYQMTVEHARDVARGPPRGISCAFSDSELSLLQASPVVEISARRSRHRQGWLLHVDTSAVRRRGRLGGR